MKSFSRVHVLHKTWNEAVSRGGRAATAKNCTKKRAAGAKVLPIEGLKPSVELFETNQTWWVKFMKGLTSGSVKFIWMSLGRLLQNRDYGAGLQTD